MILRRCFALLMIMMIMLSCAAVSSGAADYEEDVTEVTEAPTEPPTEYKPTPEELGYVRYASKLDQTTYDGELGAIYSKKATVFRLWTPAANKVKLCIYKTGSDSETGAQMLSSNPMKYSKKTGVWYLTLKGDYKNLYYTYQVTVGDKTNEVVDPYAKAVGVNGNRGMIVDLSETDPEDWTDDSFERVDNASEAVVWEVSVRDFSASESSGVSEKNRGKFMAFTEVMTTLDNKGDIPTCVNYLRRLGVNYVQINPFYDFASIDESDTGSEQYNWGYDPKNYNVPEGSYSSDPYDGRVRINECKQMIQALHDNGIGVIMDVVYNHTYFSEDSFFNQIAPYYYHRVNEDGSWSNGSGCGNDVATERYMVRKMIVDSVSYWAEEYHIDGFRFDLMGLMDTDTMNSIRKSLDALPNGKRIIMYGEAWKMSSSPLAPGTKLANQDNMYLLSDRIGAFNDTARDAIKGSVFNAAETGFVQEGKSKGGVRSAIDGDGGGWTSNPSQCVNYSSCHDNLTLYDKLTDSVYGDKKYDMRRENLVDMNKLSAAIVLMSRGMPFFLAGEEMGRTKLGDENSYISSVEINQINWTDLNKYASLVSYYKGLLKIRSSLGVFSDSGASLKYLEADGKGVIAYSLTKSGKPSAVVAFNGSPSDKAKVNLPDGKWVIVADKNLAGLNSLGTADKTVTVEPTSAVVLIDAESFGAIGSSNVGVTVARYKDKSTSDVLYEQVVSGRIGEAYSLNAPDELIFHYNVETGAALHGEFSEPYELITVECEKYEGDYSSVTIKYMDESDRLICDTVVMTNRVGQQYYTPMIPGVEGYSLDLNDLPENGSGLYTEDPIEIIYRYVVNDAEPDVDPDNEYTCRANIIYMGDRGEILDKKSFMGVEGDQVEVETLEFDGYEYVTVSDAYAAFSYTEANILVNYARKRSNALLYTAIAAAAVLIIGSAAFMLIRSSRREKMNALSIDE